MRRMRLKKPPSTTMTSSTSRDADDVTVTSRRRDADAQRRQNATVGDERRPRSLSHAEGEGHGRNQGQGRVRELTSAMTSSCECDAKRFEKPQKPTKPKDLRSTGRSRDGGTGDGEGSDWLRKSTEMCRVPADETRGATAPASQSEHSAGQSSPRSNGEQPASWTTASNVDLPSQQCAETTRGQTSPHSHAKQPTQWTAASPQPVSSSSISRQNSTVNGETSRGQSRPRCEAEQPDAWTTASTETVSRSCGVTSPSRRSDNGVEVTCGQSSPRCVDNERTPWTRTSTECVRHSPGVDSTSHSSDVTADATCGQTVPRCIDDEPSPWTELSRPVSVDVMEVSGGRIEPPVICDLLPDNVHVRRGASLRLVAQFTAFPAPDISWYRASDLLTPGETPLYMSYPQWRSQRGVARFKPPLKMLKKFQKIKV